MVMRRECHIEPIGLVQSETIVGWRYGLLVAIVSTYPAVSTAATDISIANHFTEKKPLLAALSSSSCISSLIRVSLKLHPIDSLLNVASSLAVISAFNVLLFACAASSIRAFSSGESLIFICG